MFVFKKYDKQNHVRSFMTKYLQFLCKFTSWAAVQDKNYIAKITCGRFSTSTVKEIGTGPMDRVR
jgi:hypothetical protein